MHCAETTDSDLARHALFVMKEDGRINAAVKVYIFLLINIIKRRFAHMHRLDLQWLVSVICSDRIFGVMRRTLIIEKRYNNSED